jgi:hypothetical protein
VNSRFLLLAILILCAGTIDVRSAPTPTHAPVEKKEPQKTVKVAFVNAEWREVFAWLFEQTGKPIKSCTPGGKFTFVGPPDKEYTLAEAVAIINEGLAKHPRQFILIEHEKSFSLPTLDRVVGGK